MRVSIIMGSISDREIADKIVAKLMEFGIEYDAKVISAHRALNQLQDYVKNAEDESQVFISIAGKAAHLGGVIAALTTRPVIGVPVKSSTLDGLDALLSTVQMPSGEASVTDGKYAKGWVGDRYYFEDGKPALVCVMSLSVWKWELRICWIQM